MAPMLKTAAAGLAALCIARLSETAQPIGAPESAYMAVNLARRGRLPVVINEVVKNESLVTSALSALPALAGDNCASVGEIDVAKSMGFFVTYTGEPNYPELVQRALTNGLDVLSVYPIADWGNAPWSTSEKAGNIGYLLWSTSTAVGCGVTDCGGNATNVMLCRFNPTATAGQRPFSEEYFGALKRRTVPLMDMNADDASGNNNGSPVSVPSVLLCGLFATLAIAST